MAIESKIQNNENLSIEEQQFLYRTLNNKSTFNEFPIDPDIRFEDLHLRYLYGDHNGQSLTYPETAELDEFIDEWKQTLNSAQNTGDLLMFIRKEYQAKLRELKPSSNDYALSQKKLIMLSKKVFIKAERYFSLISEKIKKIILNDVEIELNEQSFVHILIQHFAETQKPINPEKSQHPTFIRIDYLFEFIESIITKIDESGLYKNDNIRCINFRYREVDFRIYCVDSFKQVKGFKENISFIRLSTFYLIHTTEHLDDIKNNYILNMIDTELGVYLKR